MGILTAERGLGVASLPDYLAAGSRRLVRVLPDWNCPPTPTVYVLYRRANPLPARIAEAIERRPEEVGPEEVDRGVALAQLELCRGRHDEGVAHAHGITVAEPSLDWAALIDREKRGTPETMMLMSVVQPWMCTRATVWSS